jgi:WD40 repeat protein
MDDTSEPTQPEPAQAVIDCEAAEIALAARQVRTLAATEAEQLDMHLATCDRCRAGVADDTRWLVRMSSADFGTEPQLPIVDPSVFAIERELATGGMGRVSLATDRRLGRQVALKEILDPKLKVRFEREALITAHLQHPAIVPVYEAGTWPDGSAFYAMRLVAGTTLHEAIHEATTLGERLALLHHVTAMVEAIAYAHGRRVIHRDLKTTNVLVGDLGDTVVIDWGLAKSLDEAEPSGTAIPRSGADLTRVGAVMGTPGFMAPEQARGEATDERADVFALGAILYTVLAGEPPYLSDGVETAIARVAAGPPRPIAELSPEAPKDLVSICERAMAHRLDDRYPTARELATELRRFEAGQLLARSYSIRELIGRWFRKHRALVLGGMVSLTAVVIIGTLAIVSIMQSRAAEREAREQAQASLTQAIAGEAAALEEQARVSLLNGDRDPALVLLHQALLRGRDTPALRYLLAVALRDRDLLDKGGTFAKDVIANDGLLVLDGTGVVRRRNETLFTIAPPPVAAAFVRDRLVVQGSDRSLGCWNTKTGERVWHHPLQATKPDAGQIVFVAAEDDRVVFVGDREKSLVVRSLATGALVKRLAFPDEIVKVAARKAVLAVAVDDDLVRVFREDLTLARTVKAKPHRYLFGQLRQIALIDADHLVTISGNLATISDVDESEPSITLVHDLPIAELATHGRTDRIVTTTTGGTIRVWSTTGQLLGIAHVPNRLELEPVISDDGETLVTDRGSTLDVWELPGLTQRVSIPGFLADVRADGSRFSVVDHDHVRSMASPTFGRRTSFRSNGSAFVGDELLVQHYDATFYRPPKYAWPGRRTKLEIPEGAWQSSPRRLLSNPVRGDAMLIDLVSGKTHAFDTKGELALSPGGARLAIASEDTIEIIDAESATKLRTLTLRRPSAIAFLDDRQLLVAGDDTTTLLDTDTLTTTPFAKRAPHTIYVADGRVTLIGLETTTVHSPSGSVLATLATDGSRVRLSRDGALLASQEHTGAIEIFELATARSIAHVPPSVVNAFTLSPDGALVYTGNADGTVRVYEARTGRELDVRKVHRRPVKQLALSPDGKTLLADVWHFDEFPRDEVSDHTATLLDVERDTHGVFELAALVAKTGWTFDRGTTRKLAE